MARMGVEKEHESESETAFEHGDNRRLRVDLKERTTLDLKERRQRTVGRGSTLIVVGRAVGRPRLTGGAIASSGAMP